MCGALSGQSMLMAASNTYSTIANDNIYTQPRVLGQIESCHGSLPWGGLMRVNSFLLPIFFSQSGEFELNLGNQIYFYCTLNVLTCSKQPIRTFQLHMEKHQYVTSIWMTFALFSVENVSF